MKTCINLLVIMGLAQLQGCMAAKDNQAELTDSGRDSSMIIDAGKKVIDLATDQLGQLGDSGWEIAHKGACFAVGGYALRDIDGLRVSLGADPVQYFPGVSRFAGTPLQVDYIFFRQNDNSIIGQGYIVPSLRLSPGANPTGPVEVNLGYTFGCDANPDAYAGAWLGGAFAGFGVEFAYDQTVMFQRAMMARDPDTRPVDFQTALNERYFGGVNKLRETHAKLQQGQQTLSQARLSQAAQGARQMQFRVTDGFSPLSLGELIEALSSSEYAAMEEFHQTGALEKLEELRQTLSNIPEDFGNPVVEGIFKAQVNEQFGEVFSLFEGELDRLVQIVQPVFMFSRHRALDQSQLIDLRADYLAQIQREHGKELRAWVESGLDSYKERYDGIQQIRLLVFEWYHQFQGNRRVETDMTVGGHHPGSVFTGCKSLSYSPRAMVNYMRGMTLPIRVVGTAINPFKLAITLIKAPITATTSVVNMRGTIRGAAAGLQGSYVNTRYVYKIPGTSHRWESNAVGAGMGHLQSFFTKACPHDLFGEEG